MIAPDGRVGTLVDVRAKIRLMIRTASGPEEATESSLTTVVSPARASPREPTLDDLRRYAVARSLFKPTTLLRAIHKLGFVQADPIRAPARAQDLTLRHRVQNYRAGDLERRYPKLPIEEDCLVNYGFLPRQTLALLHPRVPKRVWDAKTKARADEVLAFVRHNGPTHPRDVLAAFSHGRVQGYWGGMLNASTHMLDGMHYRGLLRVAHRDNGTRVYEAVDHPPADPSPPACTARARALVETVLRKYAPMPSASLGRLVSMLGYGAPQLGEQTRRVLQALRAECASARIDGVVWLWPADENPRSSRWQRDDAVRLLAPFDPVVWDRPRFELLWGWDYRFEAYTPAPKRRYGHYALPILWGDRVIGWSNVSQRNGALEAEHGFAGSAPRSAAFVRGMALELDRMRDFLG